MLGAGLAVFVYLEYWFAGEIIGLRWWFVLGFFLFVSSAVVVLARPMYALVTWVVASPIFTHLFRLDWGAGIPSITFDRVVIYSLAMTLLIRSMVERRPVGRLMFGEWMLLLLPIYVVLTGPFFPAESTANWLLMFLRDAGDLAVFYFAVKACIQEEKHIKWLLGALILLGSYAALMAFYDHYTGRMSLTALVGVKVDLIYGDAGGRAAGPFLAPSHLGIALGIAIAAAFHVGNWARNRAVGLLCYASALPMGLAWFWTYTRGSYAVLVVALLLMPFMASATRRRYGAVLGMAILVLAVALPVVLLDKGVNRRLTNDKTLKDRIVTNRALINMIMHNPMWGVGLENSNSQMPKYAVSSGSVPGLLIWQGLGTWPHRFKLPEATSSHNTYLTIFAEHGAVGGMIFLSGFLAFLVHLWQIRARLSPKGLLGKDYPSLAICAILGFVVSINTTHIRSGLYVSMLLWLCVILAVKAGEFHDRKHQAERKAAVLNIGADSTMKRGGNGR